MELRQLAPDGCRVGRFLGVCFQAVYERSERSWKRDVSLSTTSGDKSNLEERWRKYFLHPTRWWDHRLEKTIARCPAFTHKEPREALWLNGISNPASVKPKLATLATGTGGKSPVSWNVMLTRYTKKGQNQKAMELFQQMQGLGVSPDKYTFIPVLRACACLGALEEARQVHTQVIHYGCETDMFVASCLIDVYAKCGSIEDGRRVFDNMNLRDVVVWTAMIKGYVICLQGDKALDLFREMQRGRVKPNSITFLAVVNACASVAALEEGRTVHNEIGQSGFESDPFIGSSLINMYSRCGSIEDARRVFDMWPIRDVVSWNAMITGHAKCGEGKKALQLYHQMQVRGLKPDLGTYKGVLNACACEGALGEGRRVHVEIIQSGCGSDMFVASSLVDMYAKCGSINDAWIVFQSMPTRDVVSWNAMVLGCVKCGQEIRALELIREMRARGIRPDTSTFVGILNACASLADLDEGRRVHVQIIGGGSQSDLFIGNSLVDMYLKCESLDEAWKVFSEMRTRDMVAWTSMIKGYVKCGQGVKALELFQQMLVEGVEPDSITFVSVLNACADLPALEQGRRVHGLMVEMGCESDLCVGNSLVHMYAKCGSIGDAAKVFMSMPTHDIVSWNAMLGAYALHGHAEEALQLFQQMHQGGVEMDSITFLCLLSACSHGGLVEEGICYFESMGSIYGIPAKSEHYSCMVDILGRAGWLLEAEDMIKGMPFEPDVSVWKALLSACKLHGNLQVGQHAAARVLELEPFDAAGYVLLSNIYAASGEWGQSASLQQLRKERVSRQH